MSDVRPGTLAVPGAHLYYEVRGAGPVLLLIPGSNGDAGYFTGIADALAAQYTVVTYDRRGFSRSVLLEPFGTAWADLHTDDARRLLAAVTRQPAYVFGSSAGAIVGYDLLARHSELLAGLIAHEPPLAEILPDADEWRTFFAGIHDIYLTEGKGPALQRFMAGIGMDKTARPADVDQALIRRTAGSLDFLLEHEVRQVTGFRPDLAALDAHRDRIILAGGHESRDHFPYRPTTVLAARWDTDVLDFPGDHVGSWSQPEKFAATLADALDHLRHTFD
jgi:pimeloyl-ACP methyl ester carboxylesterase